MRLVFEKGKQRALFQELKNVNGYSWRKLAKVMNLEWRKFRHLRDEDFTLPNFLFDKILEQFPNLRIYSDFIIEEREDDWGTRKGGILGGKAVAEKLKNDLVFRKAWVEKCRKGGTNNIRQGLIKNWEIGFRNVGRRRFLGPNDEKMFTEAEKRIAEFFAKKGITYRYEPKLIINGMTYFPDFIIKNNIIIERCGFLSKKYSITLNKKFRSYASLNNKVVIIIPKKIYKTFHRNVKIPKKFVKLIEDKNLSELTDMIGEYVGLN